MYAMLLVTMVLLLSFSAGCIQNTPPENTTSVIVTPTEATVPESTTVPTIMETTVVPITTVATTSMPTLSEHNQQILDQMESHLQTMITELERRETTFQKEKDDFVRLPPPDGCGNCADAVIAYDRNTSMSVKEIRDLFEDFHYTSTYKGEKDLYKLEYLEEGIAQQKADIVIKKRLINSFYKENGFPTPYESENI